MHSEDSLSDTLGLSECERCPNLVSCRSRIVDGAGPLNADVLLVGEAPGAHEDEGGEPFIGRSGDILNEALEEAGLSRADVRITNCVRCRPPENRDPHKAELANCSGYLAEEIRRVDPAVVVPLGRIPSEQVLGEPVSISADAGTVFPPSEAHPYTIVLSVHPAATLYNRSLAPTFTETFTTVADLVA